MILISLHVAAAVKSRQATAMKLSTIYFLLLTTPIKEKYACQDSRSHNGYQRVTDPTPTHQRPPSPPRPQQESIPIVFHSRAKIFNSQDDESQWPKDHEIVLSPETKRLSLRTNLDPHIRNMLVTLELIGMDPLRDSEQNENAFGDNSQFEDPFDDINSAAIPLKAIGKKCVPVTTYGDHYYRWSERPLPMDNSWDNFFAHIDNCHMYPENSDQIIDNLLDDLSNLTVTKVENFGGDDAEKDDDKGTQIKLKLTFENGKQALFKPMRYGIEYEKHPDELYFTDVERPNAEVVVFHLDKLLNFRTAVPTVDREFKISELKAAENHGVTYFTSPANNLCFYGTCLQYCDLSHALCGVNGKIRGSVQAWLPAHTNITDIGKRPELFLDYENNPYSRMYLYANDIAPWQGGKNRDFCKKNVTQREEYAAGRRLLDLVDISITDYLTGNQDRHGLEWFYEFSNQHIYPTLLDVSFIINLDNGRGFGNPHLHDLDILAPLTQCCVVRPSTVESLLEFYNEKTTLATELQAVLKKAERNGRPILAQKYLIALDHRHEIVLKEIVKCLKEVSNTEDVLMNNIGGKPRLTET